MVAEIVIGQMPSVYPSYSNLVGYTGLAIEAALPFPQIMANARSQSCKGFRVSVLANWLAGDAMKMFWFFTSSSQIPWAFKLCGIFQACCDSFLGVQYLMYGNGPTGEGVTVIKEHQLSEFPPLQTTDHQVRPDSSHLKVTGLDSPTMMQTRKLSNATDRRI